MVFHYIIREVSADAVCSYRRGRTLLDNEAYRTLGEAERRAARYNECAAVPGIRYVVVSADDRDRFDYDACEFRPHPLKADVESARTTLPDAA